MGRARPGIEPQASGYSSAATKVIGMADPFSPDAFYTSAREFALSALEAHHAGNRRRVPLDAGTALEHLAKACLAQRSPALLAELKGNSSINSLIGLLRIEGASVPVSIRTVSLSEALNRAGLFVRARASKEDLQILVELRNGVVHAAEDAEVEERILAAFVQQADALLKGFGRAREDFWGGQLDVVDTLLVDLGDKLVKRVEVRLASALAMLERRKSADGETVLSMLRALSQSAPLAANQRFCLCPVCDSFAIATGEHSVEWVPDDSDKEAGQVANADREVWFTAQAFRCPVCGLRLDSEAEIDAAGIRTAWQIEDADWRDYEPGFNEDAYEHLDDEMYKR